MPTRPSRVSVASLFLWGEEAGAVAWNDDRGVGEFEYSPKFIAGRREIAPLTMPLGPGVFSFQSINRQTYHGLPGLLADSLPDRFGNRMIDLWLARQGRAAGDFSPIERLCYIGNRGMGALEFKPSLGPNVRKSVPVELSELVNLASEILNHRTNWAVNLKGEKAAALDLIFKVGTSAGGNRAKAVVAWNPASGEVRSGQVPAPPGFEPWILKFDGVKDVSLGDPQGFGRIEYAYHRMAVAAGIAMSDCRILEENGRAHFMTRRFDRHRDNGEKIHMLSLCGMAHFDFNASGEYGYEQAFSVLQRLSLGYPALHEMFGRMVFNVLARNQDDHTRNIAFLMDRQGRWSLSPAFDMVWAYNPEGRWTNRHQMSINGKRDEFSIGDLLTVAKMFGIKGARETVDRVAEAVAQWERFAHEAGVPKPARAAIGKTHRLGLTRR
jgi:serine/threonine-protein kinase HipA